MKPTIEGTIDYIKEFCNSDYGEVVIQALEMQSNIVHCRDCENWKFPFDGFNDNVGQCELTKWLCGEQGYCMYGREVE